MWLCCVCRARVRRLWRVVTAQLRSKVTAQDSEGQWYSARMIDIDEKNKTALIHFDRWNKRYDEWIPFGSPRVRPVEKPKAVVSAARCQLTRACLPSRPSHQSHARVCSKGPRCIMIVIPPP